MLKCEIPSSHIEMQHNGKSTRYMHFQNKIQNIHLKMNEWNCKRCWWQWQKWSVWNRKSKLIVVYVHKWSTFIGDNSWQSPMEKLTKANFRIENQEKLRWFLCDGHKPIWIWSSRHTHMYTWHLDNVHKYTANDHDRKQLDFAIDLDRSIQNDLNVKVQQVQHTFYYLYLLFSLFGVHD